MTTAGPSLALGPNMPAAPRTLRVDFHVINKDDGSGCYPDTPAGRQYFIDMIQRTNDYFLDHHQRCSVPSARTFVSKSMIRLRMANLYFHNDSVAYNLAAADSSTYLYPGTHFYDNFGTNKRKNLNVFLLAIPGASGGGNAPGFNPYFFNWKGPENPSLVANDAEAGWWAHETGHTLGLYHAFADNLADTPAELAQGWIPADSLQTSNNVMSYNFTKRFLSYMQIEFAHGRLRSTSSPMRDIVQAPPSPRGLVSDTHTGMFGVEADHDLMRAFWTGSAGAGVPARWNLETIANAAFKVIPGSLVAINAATCFGVSDRYELVRTGLVPGHSLADLQALEIRSIGGPGLSPGSLVDGLQPNTLFGVDLNQHWVKIAIAGWAPCTATTISGPTMASGSLVATQMGGTPRIVGVTNGYGLVWTTGTSTTTISGSGASAVPGSLVAAGASAVYGVNQNGRLIKISPAFAASLETPGGLHGGSLAWNSFTSELFGTDPAGNVFRLVSGNVISPLQLPGIPQVVAGSLVDGRANGMFAVLLSGDLLRIYLDSGGNWTSQTIFQWGGAVVPGSGFGDPLDGGRYYGINENGQIMGTWDAGLQVKYSTIE